MARVTVEDCITKIPNRFELVMLAAQRARKIGQGAVLTLDRDNDKNPVVALREIAEETVSLEELEEDLTKGYQRVIPMDDDEEDVIDLMDDDEGEEDEADDAAADASADEDLSPLESMAGNPS